MVGEAQQYVDGAWSVLKAADVPTVTLIVFFTFLVRRTLWQHLGLAPESIVWVSIALSFILSPFLSTAEEMTWGSIGLWNKYYTRAVLYNGTVSVAVWFVLVPQILKKWPQLLDKDPTEPGAKQE